jgi:hypothetical protein
LEFLQSWSIIAGAVYFFGGFYDIAAAQPDSKPVEWSEFRLSQAGYLAAFKPARDFFVHKQTTLPDLGS